MLTIPATTAELLRDVALARSVTHKGEHTVSDVVTELIERWRLQLEQEAENVRNKRRRGEAE